MTAYPQTSVGHSGSPDARGAVVVVVVVGATVVVVVVVVSGTVVVVVVGATVVVVVVGATVVVVVSGAVVSVGSSTCVGTRTVVSRIAFSIIMRASYSSPHNMSTFRSGTLSAVELSCARV